MSSRTRFWPAAAIVILGGLAISTPARAELDEEIDLTVTHGLRLQQMSDHRWGRFSVGPRLLVDPSSEVNIARCGCVVTSLSTALENMVGDTLTQPWFAHDEFVFSDSPNFRVPVMSFAPKYVDDYLNIGPNPGVQWTPGWGYLSGSGGQNCQVMLAPGATDRIGNPVRIDGVAFTPTGVAGDTLQWGFMARWGVDTALQNGWPSIVLRQNTTGGFHANLIVGWDNSAKKYLIYDPLWSVHSWCETVPGACGHAPGVELMGHGWATGANPDEQYSNYQKAIANVRPLRPVFEATPFRWMGIFDDPEPIELRLTDPRGRRTGYDPATGETLQENVAASYDVFTSFADPFGVLPEAEPYRFIAVRDPEAGAYGLEVFGTGTGTFALTLAMGDGGPRQDLATVTGSTAAGQIQRYEIIRAVDGALSIAAVAAFAPRAQAGNDALAFAGGVVSFDGRGSRQIDGAITAYSWAFGDGTSATGVRQTHVYTTPGTYKATLTVTNGAAQSGSDDREVVIFPATAHPKETIRASVASDDTEADGPSWYPQLAEDGRHVVFLSHATNLVADDSNGLQEVFVKDLLTGEVERVPGANGYPAISATGRFISFISACATNEVTGLPVEGLCLLDRDTHTTEAITRTDGGIQRPSITPDGRYIAFTSSYDGLGAYTGRQEVYLRDRQLGTSELVSTPLYGGTDPHVSADGRFVAYAAAYGPDGLDTNGATGDVYLRDRQAGTTELISRTATGEQIRLADSFNPSISADGRLVSFAVLNRSFGQPYRLFVRDRLLGTTEQIGEANGLFAGDRPFRLSSMSASGRYLAFMSFSGQQLAYVHDRQEGTTELATVTIDGNPAGLPVWSDTSVISDGAVAFWSNTAGVVVDDTNGTLDVFVRRPVAGGGGGAAAPRASLGGPYAGWASRPALPAAIRLDGSGSLDPGGRALAAHWDFGDGSPVVDAALVTTHAYARPGLYQVSLTVSAGADTSAPARTEVEVLPTVPPDGFSVDACTAAGGSLALQGAAPGMNLALLANGWDTSTGPPQLAPVTVTLPWGRVEVATHLPGLTFDSETAVPPGLTGGSYLAEIAGVPAAAFAVPCATSSDLPPIAVAGGPIYSAQAGLPVILDGAASSDPEGAPLSYRWELGDGAFVAAGTAAQPHTYAYPGSYFVTLVVNDGTQDSAAMIGTRSFALVEVSEAPPVTCGECDDGDACTIDTCDAVNGCQHRASDDAGCATYCSLSQGAYGAANSVATSTTGSCASSSKLGVIVAARCLGCDVFAGDPNATTIGIHGTRAVTLDNLDTLTAYLPSQGKPGPFDRSWVSADTHYRGANQIPDRSGAGSRGQGGGTLAGQTLTCELSSFLSACAVPWGGKSSFSGTRLDAFTVPPAPLVCTRRSGGDQLLGTGDDICEAFRYPSCVAGQSVAAITAAANRQLATGSNPMCTSGNSANPASDLTQGLSNVNEQFDSCGKLAGCVDASGSAVSSAGRFACAP